METKQPKPKALNVWMIISQGIGLIVALFPVFIFVVIGGGEFEKDPMYYLTFCINPLIVIGLTVASRVFASKKQYKRASITTSAIVAWISFFIILYIVNL